MLQAADRDRLIRAGFAILTLLVTTAACEGRPRPFPTERATPPAMEITYVDHATLRRFDPDPEVWQAEIRRLRRHFDEAQKRGVKRYLLFARDFETLLTYDFEVEGIGPVGARAFPPDDPWRRQAQLHRDVLNLAIEEAAQRDIAIIYHSNQMEFPDPVWDVVAPHIGQGDEVCPDREVTWRLYRAKLREFFEAVPEVAGLQVTADETEHSVLGCMPDGRKRAEGQEAVDRVDRLVNETQGVAAEYGKFVEARSWGRIYSLSETADPRKMFEGLDPGIRLSIKNTQGDFHSSSPASPLIGIGGDRQILEFDAWREHEGWNFYPGYMGEIWAPRIRQAHAAGVTQLAVRINWDGHANPIFERPWGNLVNLELLHALARDPRGEPRALLEEILTSALTGEDMQLDEAARTALVELYERSSGFQRTMNAWEIPIWASKHAIMDTEADPTHWVPVSDHSRLLRPRDDEPFERVDQRLKALALPDAETGLAPGDAGFVTTRLFAARRNQVDAALAAIEADLASAGGSLPGSWRAGLGQGARAEWYMARGVTDQLELGYRRREGDALEADEILRWTQGVRLEDAARAMNEAWRREDPASYSLLEGEALPEMLRAAGYPTR